MSRMITLKENLSSSSPVTTLTQSKPKSQTIRANSFLNDNQFYVKSMPSEGLTSQDGCVAFLAFDFQYFDFKIS